jgi:ATP synthase F1 gamma subunit
MSEITNQQRRIRDVEDTKYITGALRDISAIEMKTLRTKFEKNKQFYEEIRNLYQLMWLIANEAGHADKLSPPRGDSLYVAYTTNRHFYGSLNQDVMRRFIRDTSPTDTCLIIGDTGSQLWVSNAKKRQTVRFLSFKDDTPDAQEIVQFLDQVSSYAHVHVFYPRFVSVYSQDVDSMDITFRPSRDTGTAEHVPLLADAPHYLLEPDIIEMSSFFSTQVRYVLFEQLLLETQLSRVSARLVKMDVADQNADGLIRTERQELRRAFSSFSSRRMLETLVGYLQWHTHRT